MIGVQLYSVRDVDLAWPALFERLAGMGYEGIETVGMPGGDAAQARRWAADAGLRILGTHVGVSPGLAEPLEARFEAVAAMGADLVFTPSLVASDIADIASLERTAACLEDAAARAATFGLAFGVHNHEHEVVELEGIRAYRRLHEQLPAAVAWQVDVYWAACGGVAPATMIDDLQPRVRSIHLKDGTGRRGDANVALGDGTIDLVGSIAAATAAGVDRLIVEFDSCATDILAALERSRRFLAT
ncbi:MAG TPA: sugar phosphate isomerase/epimerase [Candidatus Limnocylindrales bacterium]|nr:sugar phosphate isomerase/epimerase [Candidatus Limnocylindrales bacterium]